MKSNDKLTIAENIEKYQQKLGISQNRVPKLADVTYNPIIEVESRATKIQPLNIGENCQSIRRWRDDLI